CLRSGALRARARARAPAERWDTPGIRDAPDRGHDGAHCRHSQTSRGHRRGRVVVSSLAGSSPHRGDPQGIPGHACADAEARAGAGACPATVADMSGRLADVVIPVYADVEVTRACIESVLWMSGEAVRRVIVVNDCAPDPAMAVMLEGLAQAHPAMVLLTNEQNLGFVGSANRGLAARHGDAVLLNSDTLV